MVGVIDPARKDELVQRAASPSSWKFSRRVAVHGSFSAEQRAALDPPRPARS
jgi:hypothetical protein